MFCIAAERSWCQIQKDRAHIISQFFFKMRSTVIISGLLTQTKWKALSCRLYIIKAHNHIRHVIEGNVARREQIQCMRVLTVRGYFTATEARERAGEMLNGTSFRVGTGTFLRLQKQNISAAEKKKIKKQKRKRQLVFLIYRSNKLMVKTLHGQMTKDGTTVYISAKTARADSADLSSRLLCSIRTAKTRSLAVLALVLNLRTSADQLLLDLGALFPFILETSQKCFVFVFFCCAIALH